MTTASWHLRYTGAVQLLLNALIAGSLLALVAGGLSLVYGTMGIFNLALGQLALVGGYVTWFAMSSGLSFSLALLVGLTAGVLASWLTYVVAVRPFFGLHPHLPIVTTVAWGMVLDGALLLVFGEQPVSLLPEWRSTFAFFGGRVSELQLGLCITTLLIVAVAAHTLHATALGRRIRAVVLHAPAALSLGIAAPALHLLLFLASGLLAACAGIFLALDQSLSPTLAFTLTIRAYAAVICGGRGHFWGAVACAYGIALLEQLVVGLPWLGGDYLPAGYQFSVTLAVIIIVLLVRPTGLFVGRSRTT